MSSDTAIRVSGLTKHYRLYDKPEDRLKESLYPLVAPLLRRLPGYRPRVFHRAFSALQDVSFEVRKGATVGIVGCNGSGKSTLLQMICGTLSPSAGSIETGGRVAALLELGSGFNPEFTGRENVYMNAMILGMSLEQVDERFAAIAAFADIGDFIEQPVKTYSSGMMLRLAFAVIAHVDADILVIDEALSVGDAIFTQKCMRFIQDFQTKGTLLFVSHDMGAVQKLCETSIWLENGRVRMMGPSKQVADAYLQATFQATYGDDHALSTLGSDNAAADAVNSTAPENRAPENTVPENTAVVAVTDNLSQANGWKTGSADVISVTLIHRGMPHQGVFRGGEAVTMSITALAYASLEQPILGFIFKDRLGQDLFGENTLACTAAKPVLVSAGETFKAEFDFVMPMLPDGDYVVMASVADGDQQVHVQHHYLHDALVVSVSSSRIRWGLMGIAFERVAMETQRAN